MRLHYFLLIGLSILITSCYKHVLFKENGDFSEVYSLKKYDIHRKHISYCSDSSIVKGFYINLVENCFTKNNIDSLDKILSEQNTISTYNYIINDFSPIPSKNCVGIFFISKRNDSKQKKSISVPLLKSKNSIFLNTQYLNGKYNQGDSTKVMKEVLDFKRENRNVFTEEELSKIEKYYMYGIITKKTRYSPRCAGCN